MAKIRKHLHPEYHLKKARKSIHHMKSEYRIQVSTAITAAFGFIIALAWRDLITAIIDRIMKSRVVEGTVAAANLQSIYTLIYAVLVTVLCVIGIILISRWDSKEQK